MKERSIRLFISSTFRDMNAERDYLNNYIFPQIKSYCHTRFIDFTPIDLRWGITEEESRNAMVLASCLDEIDNSMPFFLGFLGTYYGTQPGKDELNCMRPSITKNKEWLNKMIAQKASITEIEMEYAALSNKKRCRGLFFVKQDNADIPDSFKETDPDRMQKLLKLRHKIEEQNRYPVHEYTDIHKMGELLLKELKHVIDTEYTSDSSDYETSIINRHEASLDRRSITFFELPNIERDMNRWFDNKWPTLVFTGPAGSGTSNYMTNVVKYLRNEYSAKIIYYDFECADTQKEPFEDFLDFMRLEKNHIDESSWSVIAIDNASDLDSEQVEQMKKWLRKCHVNLHVMFAASYSILQTEMSLNGADIITMKGLSHEMQYQFIQQFTKVYGKKLTSEQQHKIVKGEHSNDPTILEMMLQSLVNFGSIERLDERITHLVDRSNNSLFLTMVEEGEKNFYDVGMYEEFTSAIVTIASHGTYGVSEQDVMGILNIPMSKWAVISPLIKSFCNGNPRKLILARTRTYKQEIKDWYDTPWIAQVGIKAIEWWVKQDKSIKEIVTSMTEIYLYIWHLPMSDKQEARLYELIQSVLLSPESVLQLPLIYLSQLWNFKSLKCDYSATPSMYIGKELSTLPYEQQENFYLKLIRLSMSMNKGEVTLWAYKKLIGICCDEEQRDIYKAYKLLTEGKPNMAIKCVTGFLGRVSGRDEIIHKKRIIRLKAFMLLNDISKYMKEFSKILESFPKETSSDALPESLIATTAEYAYKLAISGNNTENCRKSISLCNTLINDNGISSMCYTNLAPYYFFMTQALLNMWMNDWKGMQSNAEHAQMSAYHAFGTSSYQYGRSDALWNYAYYKINGKVYNDSYINAKYIPMRYMQISDFSSFEKNVCKSIEEENQLYTRLVKEIS